MNLPTILSIVSITSLLFLATFNGIDGMLLTSGIAVIAGLGGFAYGKKRSSK